MATRDKAYDTEEGLAFQAYLDANPLDDDSKHSSPYPEGLLQKMSAKQLKRERLKQISDADNAELGSKEESLAESKLVYVLFELDRRKIKVNYN